MKPINIAIFCVAVLTSENAFASSPEPTDHGLISTWIAVLLGVPEAIWPTTTDGNGREIKIEVPS